MEQQHKDIKLILRNLQKTQRKYYITSQSAKQDLNFPKNCISNFPAIQAVEQQNVRLVSIDCEMIQTQNLKTGIKQSQICRVVILDQDQTTILYNKWFLPLQGYQVVNYLTHITGIDQKKLSQNAQKTYDQDQKEEILSIIKDKIVVGHDLANDLDVLKIQHHLFIDTVALYPHHYGLPLKFKLKNLAMQLLGMPIQWSEHNPQQDAEAALKIVKKHIKQGKGTLEQIKYTAKPHDKYKDVWEIIEQVQLDPKKVIGLFLRGSRALDLVLDLQDYKSDWDYVCIYDTTAVIDGKLLKLQEIDISFFDVNTFNKIIYQDFDISMIQLFYLPVQHQIVNKFKPIQDFNMQKLRETVGLHCSKAKVKIQRFKNDADKEWKCLKAVHLKMRFIDNFLQILEFGCIKDVKRLNPVWEEFKAYFIKSGNFKQSLSWCEKQYKQMSTKMKANYQSIRRVRHFDHKQQRKGGLRYIDTDAKRKNKNKDKNKHLQSMYKATQQQMGQFISQYSTFPCQQKNKQNEADNKENNSLQIVKQCQNHSYWNLEEYKISMKRGTLYPNLVEFHYLQSCSFKHKICEEARGIILDQDNNFSVVACPYWKFYDYNDPKHSQLKQFNFDSYKIYEKNDGSIAFIYWYKEQWHVASAKVPDGQSNYCFARKQTTTQFRKEFWRIFKSLKYQLPNQKDRHKTFIFELMSKNHIIVVNRKQDKLVLHGVRNVLTLKEESELEPYRKQYNWQVSRPVDLEIKNKMNPIEQIVAITEKLNPLEQQGFILCDDKFTRLKIKCSDYVRINWLGELNITASKDPARYILAEIVLAGQADTFMKYCPQWAKVIQSYLTKIQRLNERCLEVYQQIKHLKGKQFAREAAKYQKEKIDNFLFALKKHFALYNGKVEQSMNPKKFYRYITEYQP